MYRRHRRIAAVRETLPQYEPICMLLVQTSPPLVRTHTCHLEPRFPDGAVAVGSWEDDPYAMLERG